MVALNNVYKIDYTMLRISSYIRQSKSSHKEVTSKASRSLFINTRFTITSKKTHFKNDLS
jgi:hypothetical protein